MFSNRLRMLKTILNRSPKPIARIINLEVNYCESKNNEQNFEDLKDKLKRKRKSLSPESRLMGELSSQKNENSIEVKDLQNHEESDITKKLKILRRRKSLTPGLRLTSQIPNDFWDKNKYSDKDEIENITGLSFENDKKN